MLRSGVWKICFRNMKDAQLTNVNAYLDLGVSLRIYHLSKNPVALSMYFSLLPYRHVKAKS